MLHRHLTLEHIGTCTLRPLDAAAAHMLETLSHIMCLQHANSGSNNFPISNEKIFNIQVDGSLNTPTPVKPPLVAFQPIEGKNCDLVTVRGVADPDARIAELSLIAIGMARHFESIGGALIHGALIMRNGCGVILAGPSQIGKSTACARLPDGWHSLSDDTTLIVPSSSTTYAAHPWPTWSRHMFGGPGGTWDVRKGVPLKSIFFLKRGDIDQVQAMGQGEAACMLMRATQQISQIHLPGVVPETCMQEFRTVQFDNVCGIARRVRCRHLTISHEGRFHDEIDRTLMDSL